MHKRLEELYWRTILEKGWGSLLEKNLIKTGMENKVGDEKYWRKFLDNNLELQQCSREWENIIGEQTRKKEQRTLLEKNLIKTGMKNKVGGQKYC